MHHRGSSCSVISGDVDFGLVIQSLPTPGSGDQKICQIGIPAGGAATATDNDVLILNPDVPSERS
jgi:hypothetical protein